MLSQMNRFAGEQKQTKVFISAQMRQLSAWIFKMVNYLGIRLFDQSYHTTLSYYTQTRIKQSNVTRL